MRVPGFCSVQGQPHPSYSPKAPEKSPWDINKTFKLGKMATLTASTHAYWSTVPIERARICMAMYDYLGFTSYKKAIGLFA